MSQIKPLYEGYCDVAQIEYMYHFKLFCSSQDKIDVTVLREMLDSIRREGNEGALTVRSLR